MALTPEQRDFTPIQFLINTECPFPMLF